MHNRKVAAYLLAVATLFLAVPALSAVEPRKDSHRSIGSGGALDETELAQRLQATQDLNALINLAEKIKKNPDKFPKLSDRQKNDLLNQFLSEPDKKRLLADPRMQKLFREAMKNQKLSDKQLQDLGKQLDQISPEDLRKLAAEASKNPGDFKLDDREREQLRKLAEQWQGGPNPIDFNQLRDLVNKAGQNPDLPPEDLDALQRTLPAEPRPGPGQQPGVEPMNPVPGTPGAEQPSSMPLPPPAEDEDPTAPWIDVLADFIGDLDPDSEWLGKASDWLRGLTDDDDSNSSPAKTVLRQTVNWVTSLDAAGWLPSDDTRRSISSWFSNFNSPSLPKVGGSPPTTSGGLPAGTGSVDVTSLAEIVVGIAVFVLLGVAAWRLRLWYQGDNGAGYGRSARWPVPPDAVATRGDLVRAFEYLALWLLGVDARHRHHLDLAERLGGPSPEPADSRRQAANHLAHLYELARYAPEDEPLPEADLAAARRDLSYLAGAGAA